MAVQLMPPAKLRARPSDLQLTEEQMLRLSLFAGLKRKPSLTRFPGALVLRRFRKGEVVCRQGEAGWTAFYVLAAADWHALQRGRRAPRAGDDPAPSLYDVTADEPRKAATAHLAVARPTPRRRRGLSGWLRGHGARAAERPVSIPADAPADIDYETLQADIHEGELFGEKSCMYHTVRATTVVAARDCYMLEMNNNILEQLQKDPAFKAREDAIYRRRVLQLHLRQLSVFGDLTEGQIAEVRDDVELLSFEAGQLICDEFERSDSLFIVRSGLVRAVKNVSALLGPGHVADWKALCAAFVAAEREPDSPPGAVCRLLPDKVRNDLRIPKPSQLSGDDRAEVLHALNDLIRGRRLQTDRGFRPLIESAAFRPKLRDFPADLKAWSEQDHRRLNRLLLAEAFPGVVPPPRRGPGRTVSYASRGELIGEWGLLTGEPRGTTCLAFGHRVELVRIPRELFWELTEASPEARRKAAREISLRTRQAEEHTRAPVWDETSPLLHSQRAEELGLVEGQKLMLIDLDRCTRCDECVKACVATHDDGRTRLFLDGPRFGKYLVPTTCRSCLDPVCMIGCPVGSIHRGEDGQMAVEDWCIGCNLCSSNCPYGAIQMHDVGLVPAGARGWRYLPAAAAAGPWQHPAYRDHHWAAGRGPFRLDRELRVGLAGHLARLGLPGGPAAGEALCFRLEFEVAGEVLQPDSQFKLEVTTPDEAVAVWLNGLPLRVDRAKGPKREFWLPQSGFRSAQARHADGAAATVRLRPGRNLVAARVRPPSEGPDVFFDLRLDEVHRPTVLDDVAEAVTQKIVTHRAVVCDLCCDQPGGQPACVSACPHDAALRINARAELPAY